MTIRFTNNASGELASSITNADTSITLNTGQGARFPSLGAGQFFFATLFDASNNLEIVRVNARSGDTLTVVRGQDGTTARSYIAGSRIELRVVAAVLDDFAQKSDDQTFTGANTFSGATLFSGTATFSNTIVGSINGNAATVTNGVYTTGDQTIGGIKTFSAVVAANGNISINNVAPLITLIENDQVSPAGRRRIVQDGNQFTVRRNTAAAGDFSTEVNDITSDATGNFTASGNVTAFSDERLKKDWDYSLLSGTYLIEMLSNVRAGTYTRIDTEERHIGVSAQSLDQVMPEAVIEDPDGRLSVAYGNAALVACIALAREVVQLRARVEALEAR